MTAADWEIRVLANYLTLGWALVFTVSATPRAASGRPPRGEGHAQDRSRRRVTGVSYEKKHLRVLLFLFA